MVLSWASVKKSLGGTVNYSEWFGGKKATSISLLLVPIPYVMRAKL